MDATNGWNSKQTGSTPQRWTPEEDAALRRIAAPKRARSRRSKLPRKALLRALPGRTWAAIHARYLKLVPQRPARHWTEGEDAALTAAWREHGNRAVLAAVPGRTWAAICKRVEDLRLGSVPQGWVTFRGEHLRLGCCRHEADAVVAWAAAWAPLVRALCAWGYQCAMAARVSPAPSGPLEGLWPAGEVATRLHTTSLSRTTAPKTRWLLVEEGAFEDALLRRLAWETMSAAAERIGVKRQAMERAFHAQGWAAIPGELPVRLPPAWWDACAAAAGLRGGGRSAAEHARRLGVAVDRVSAALAAAGVPSRGVRGARGYYPDAEVDAALAAYAVRPGVRRARGERKAAAA